MKLQAGIDYLTRDGKIVQVKPDLKGLYSDTHPWRTVKPPYRTFKDNGDHSILNVESTMDIVRIANTDHLGVGLCGPSTAETTESNTWDSSEYIAFHKEACDKMVEITARKNADYTAGRTADAFANFRIVEKLGVGSVEQGFLTRMTDKLARLISLTTGHQVKVKDESLEDTLLDLANYCILLAGYLKSKR